MRVLPKYFEQLVLQISSNLLFDKAFTVKKGPVGGEDAESFRKAVLEQQELRKAIEKRTSRGQRLAA